MPGEFPRDNYEQNLLNYREVLQTDLKQLQEGFESLRQYIEAGANEEDVVHIVNWLSTNYEIYKNNLGEYLNRRYSYKHARFN